MEELKRRLVNYLMDDDYGDLEASMQIDNAKITTEFDLVTIEYNNGVTEIVHDDNGEFTQVFIDTSNRK